MKAVAAKIPVMAVVALLGLDNLEFVQAATWSNALESLSSGMHTRESSEAVAENYSTLPEFLLAEFAKRRVQAGNDPISAFPSREMDGMPVSDTVAYVYISALFGYQRLSLADRGACAGYDGTSRAVCEFARHPALAPSAVDEKLHWVSPARSFGRTAVDPELAGVSIRCPRSIQALDPYVDGLQLAGRS